MVKEGIAPVRAPPGFPYWLLRPDFSGCQDPAAGLEAFVAILRAAPGVLIVRPYPRDAGWIVVAAESEAAWAGAVRALELLFRPQN